VQVPHHPQDAQYIKGFNMTRDVKSGDWTVRIPFPSGIFNYAYYPDCWQGWGNRNCTALTDPSNPPLERQKGDQLTSTIEVPFDGRFQERNYDKFLPLQPASRRGSIRFVTYPSPGSTYPKKDVHQVGIYLPREYGKIKGKKYPVLYLHHGGGGTDSDWLSQGRAHNILDRLIESGDLEPTVCVTPNFYNLGFNQSGFPGDSTGFFNAVRENYFKYLIPWVNKNYNVRTDREGSAFGGLSLGGSMTLAMLFNATESWSETFVMSNVAAPAAGSAEYNNPLLNDTKIWTGAGFYDFALPTAKAFEDGLTRAGVTGYRSHWTMAAHDWHTWPEQLWVWGKYGLWK
jgi:predicted esterase